MSVIRRKGAASLATALLAMLLAGACTQLAPTTATRFIAAAPPPAARGAVLAELDRRLRAMVAGVERARLRRAAGLGPGDSGQAHLPTAQARAALAAAERASAPLDGGRIAPLPRATPDAGPGTYREIWRRAESHLYLGSEQSGAAPQPFHFSGLQAAGARIRLHSIQPYRDLALRVRCDGPVTLHRPDAGRRSYPAGREFGFTLPAGAEGRTRMDLGPAVSSCTLHSEMPGRPGVRTLKIEREETADPAQAARDSRVDLCTLPPPESLDRLERAFLADRWLSQSCLMDSPDGDARLLSDSRSAFNAKVAALTGRPLSLDDLDAGDPAMPLDFADAPRLDLIYVSTLHVRADFTGMMMARMLRHHAARGAKIRILTTRSMMLKKDRRIIETLAADYPNVQVQHFAWTPPGPGAIGEQIDRVHRAHHVKIFAALSPRPGRSRVMVGGRNLHDGFVFETPRDLGAFPALRDYEIGGPRTLSFFSSYVDFELELRDDAAADTVAAHFATLWHRDAESAVMRPFSVARQGDAPRRGMRHFISMPYVDGRAQEEYFVELLDAARHSIRIVTPFLNLSPALEGAFERAIARGVEITLVARIRVTDPGGSLITQLNRRFVERYAGRVAIHEYAAGERMLHSKLLLIDGRLSVVTSTNMNRRSFLHDSENGIAVLDEGFHARMQEVFDGYLAQSRRLSPEVEIPPLFRLLFRLEPLMHRF